MPPSIGPSSSVVQSTPHRLLLASTSRWRRELLAAAGIPCLAVAPDVNEDEHGSPGDDPVAVARLRALAKARAVAGRNPGRIVVGADQVVHLDGAWVGKPTDPEDWLRRLRSFRGREHLLTTAVAICDEAGEESFEVHSAVRFRSDLSDADLRAYIAHGEAAGCAGGYMVEGRGAWLVEAVEGDWTNVVGLPIFALVGRLRSRGWRLCADGLARAPQEPMPVDGSDVAHDVEEARS